jgi:hypothetical protein
MNTAKTQHPACLYERKQSVLAALKSLSGPKSSPENSDSLDS